VPAHDARGRFVAAGGSFDGGVRAPVPQRRPEREHDQLIVQLSHLSRADGTRF
jgi:hypothetical protein